MKVSKLKPFFPASRVGGSAVAAYAVLTASHQDTANVCALQGVDFIPLVAETTGADFTGNTPASLSNSPASPSEPTGPKPLREQI